MTQAKDYPIIFDADSVRATLAGRKTQTRRVVLPGENRWLSSDTLHHDVRRFEHRKGGYWGMAVGAPSRIEFCGHEIDGGHIGSVRCPYGVPGSRLWVRERLIRWADDGIEPLALYDAGHDVVRAGLFLVKWRWKNAALQPRYMPRACARIILEVVDVRVERLRTISEKDCEIELGMRPYSMGNRAYKAFRERWDGLNAKRGYAFDSNPWVWAITYKVLRNSGGV